MTPDYEELKQLEEAAQRELEQGYKGVIYDTPFTSTFQVIANTQTIVAKPEEANTPTERMAEVLYMLYITYPKDLRDNNLLTKISRTYQVWKEKQK